MAQMGAIFFLKEKTGQGRLLSLSMSLLPYGTGLLQETTVN